MNISWLEKTTHEWRQRVSGERVPHAVMLQGPPGNGKRSLAAWMARQRLDPSDDSLPEWPLQVPENADLHWLTAPEDKQTIGVDAVRALVTKLTMTSYGGGAKVAVIEPADVMTSSAANGLLKTLEEPPGDTMIVLVADRSSHLPATILSRCQKIRINCPPVAEALDWLQQCRSSQDWTTALAAAGGAPLKAIEAIERLDEIAAMTREFCEVASGAQSPLAVAAAWKQLEPRAVLDWLSGEVQKAIRAVSNGPDTAESTVAAESVRQRMDSRNLFCYLDIINRLRAQPAGSYNVQLTFESLLIDWSRGLAGVEHRNGMQSARLPGMGR